MSDSESEKSDSDVERTFLANFKHGKTIKEISGSKVSEKEGLANQTLTIMAGFNLMRKEEMKTKALLDKMDDRVTSLERNLRSEPTREEALKKGKRTLYFQPVMPYDWTGNHAEADITELLKLFGVKNPGDIRILDCWQNGKSIQKKRLMVEFASESTAEIVSSRRGKWNPDTKEKDDHGRFTDKTREPVKIKTWIAPLFNKRHELLNQLAEDVRAVAKGEGEDGYIMSLVSYVGNDIQLSMRLPGRKRYTFLNSEDTAGLNWKTLVETAENEERAMKKAKSKSGMVETGRKHPREEDEDRVSPAMGSAVNYAHEVSQHRGPGEGQFDSSLEIHDVLTDDEEEETNNDTSRKLMTLLGPKQQGGAANFSIQQKDYILNRLRAIKKIKIGMSMTEPYTIDVKEDLRCMCANFHPVVYREVVVGMFEQIREHWRRTVSGSVIEITSYKDVRANGVDVGGLWTVEISEFDGSNRDAMVMHTYTTSQKIMLQTKGVTDNIFKVWELAIEPLIKVNIEANKSKLIESRNLMTSYFSKLDKSEAPKPQRSPRKKKAQAQDLPQQFRGTGKETRCKSCKEENIKGKVKCSVCGARTHGQAKGCVDRRGVCKPCNTLKALQKQRDEPEITYEPQEAAEEAAPVISASPEAPPLRRPNHSSIETSLAITGPTTSSPVRSIVHRVRSPSAADAAESPPTPAVMRKSREKKRRVPLPTAEAPVVRALNAQIAIHRKDKERLMKYTCDLERRLAESRRSGGDTANTEAVKIQVGDHAGEGVTLKISAVKTTPELVTGAGPTEQNQGQNDVNSKGTDVPEKHNNDDDVDEVMDHKGNDDDDDVQRQAGSSLPAESL